MSKRWVSALALWLVLVSGISAQEAGQIVGVVRDTTGAFVPGVTITATETGTGFASSVKTGTEGQFVLPSLRPTTYVITAEMSGFRRFNASGVELLANQSLTLNIAMEVGAVSETVNVSGQVVQVDTSTSTLAEVVDQARIV